jgi:hypothetical protein
MAGYCRQVTNSSADAGPDAHVIDTVIDAAPGDASLATDGAPGDAAWPPNLLADPGFENGDDGWIGFLATTSITTSKPHTGTHALRVCKDDVGHGSFFSLYRDVFNQQPLEVPIGARFRAQAWVRASTGPNDIAPTFVSPVLRERGGPTPFVNHEGPLLDQVTGDWTLVTAEAVITGVARNGLSFILETDVELDGTCFAIDDAYVGRL